MAASTNLTVTVSSVRNPSTTTTTSSIAITTYYEDISSIVDTLSTGLTVTAGSVPLQGVSLSSSSYKVGANSNYTVTIQISNELPAAFHVEIQLPVDSFSVNTLLLRSVQVQKPSDSSPTTYSSCSLSTLSSLNVKISSSCFSEALPAQSNIIVTLGNITNPLSTKPSSSWEVETFFGDRLME